MCQNQQSTSLMRFRSKVTFEPVTEDVTGKKKARKRFSTWREKKKRIKVFSAGLSALVLLQASSSLVFPGSGTNQITLVLRVFPSSRLVSAAFYCHAGIYGSDEDTENTQMFAISSL